MMADARWNSSKKYGVGGGVAGDFLGQLANVTENMQRRHERCGRGRMKGTRYGGNEVES